MRQEIEAPGEPKRRDFTQAEIGAIAHLWRGEVYRSTIWRTRLDTTTNWAVVTLGIALSIAFASPGASPLPLVLVGVLILLFLVLEARRYRYFNVWRARCRYMERHFYAPMLTEGDLHLEDNWQDVLAQDYLAPNYHIGFVMAMGRRIRRNYLWILTIQTTAFFGKIAVHPTALTSVAQIWERSAIGPLPGGVTVAFIGLYLLGFFGIAVWSWASDYRRAKQRGSRGSAMG
ncbi:DUF2270 domain-containing protein [Maliponia aquimaris]|uniref:DUF2270 domain-containing protein n=1 Tax=Maliponia aquimaris TaxID=1673631 RepID=A0A238L0L2_9RHOB|nr:DUF2270 domain-containing protein [Maliponia aquimaris]SMX48361.1 hypothetical protein MAA8898_03912 [Maliponia aquimaris]